MTSFPSWLSRPLRWGFWCGALLLITLGLLTAAGRQFIPLLGAYPQKVAARVSDALGMPVHIDALQGDWPGLTPRVRLRNIRIGQGRQALEIGGLDVRLNLLGSLLARRWTLTDLQVQGIKVTLEEDEQGQWRVRELPAGGDNPMDLQAILDNLDRSAQVGLHRAEVELRPFGQAAVRLTGSELALRMARRGPRLDGLVRLPDGQPLTFSLRLTPNLQDWRRSAGRLYLSLPQSDWAAWIPRSLLSGWHLQRLRAGGELWLDWRDRQLQQGVLRLNSQQLSARYRSRQPLQLQDLGFTAFVQRESSGYLLQIDPLAATFGDSRWNAAGLILRQQTEAGGQNRWQLQIQQIDLGLLAPAILATAPLTEKTAQLLRDLHPRGLVNDLAVDYRPQAVRQQRLAVRADLRGVGFSAVRDIPGAQGVSGRLHSSLDGGELAFSGTDMQLHLAKLFPRPWPFTSAEGRLSWRLDDNRVLSLAGRDLRTQGPLGNINGEFLLHDVEGHPEQTYLDLGVGLRNGDLRHLGELLPTRSRGFSPELADWLSKAIPGGIADEAYFVYQGVLKDEGLPNARQMALYVSARDSELRYRAGWPVLRRLQAEVLMEGDQVRVRAPSARVLDSQARDIQAEVAKNAAGVTHVRVKAGLRSSLTDGLRFMAEAPLPGLKTFAGWRGQGPLQGSLDLDIPLGDKERPKVVVDFSTRNADLLIDQPQLHFQALEGKFKFDSERGLSASAIKARFDGRPITARIQSEGAGGRIRSRVLADGSLPWSAVAQRFKLDTGLPVAGSLPYRVDLLLGDGGGQLQLSSGLQGLAIDLPAPLGKTAGQARPTTLRMAFGDGTGKEQRVNADYAGLAKLALALPQGNAAAVRGDLHLGSGSANVPAQAGLRISGTLDRLDLAAWQGAYQRFSAGSRKGAAKGAGALGAFRGGQLRIRQADVFGQQLRDLQVTLQRQAQRWRLAVDSGQLAGTVLLPDAGTTPIQVALQRLRLPKGKGDLESKSPAVDPMADFDPRRLPAVNVSIDRVFLGPDLLGRWAFTIRRSSGGARIGDIDMQLKKSLRLTGTLDWSAARGAAESRFNGEINGQNLRDALQAWGYAPTVASRDFRVRINGDWPGSIAAFNLKTLSGTANVRIRHGEFVEVQGPASALKIFGLLNFNTLGRRLRFDFSDVLGSGLEFDEISGNVVVRNGVYRANDELRMRGPSVGVTLTGTLDMPRNRVDSSVLVTLPLTNNLPLAAVLAGAPAVGGALFIINRVLGNRMDRLASVRYHIEGPLDKPKVSPQQARGK